MMLNLPDAVRQELARARALIFDLDGTLVQTHDAHERSWRQAFNTVGLHMPTSWYRERTGLTAVQLVDDMGKLHGTALDASAIRAVELRYFLEEARTLAPFDPVSSIAEGFGDASHMAVASNGDARTVHATLEGAGIAPLFSVIITADDGLRPKPFPDAFLMAAERMAVETDRCLVFEDTEGEIAAAHAVGMRVVDVRTWDLPQYVRAHR